MEPNTKTVNTNEGEKPDLFQELIGELTNELNEIEKLPQQFTYSFREGYKACISDIKVISKDKDYVSPLQQENQQLKQLVAESTAILLDCVDKPTYLKALEENQQLREALEPFKNLAECVFKYIDKSGNRTIYAYDKAEITMKDLRAVEQALQNTKG